MPTPLAARLMVPAMYLPAFGLVAGRILVVAKAANGTFGGHPFSLAIERLDRFEQLYLFACCLAAIWVLTRPCRTSVHGRSWSQRSRNRNRSSL